MAATVAIYLLLLSLFGAEACSVGDCNIFGVSLDCQDLKLQDVPGSGVCETYVQIKLHGNIITSLNASSFSSFPNFQLIDISINAISEVEGSTFVALSNLKELNLTQNRLKELPVSSSLSKMEKLHLKSNYFTTMESINAAVRNMPNLKYLDISDNRLSATDTTKPLLDHAQLSTLVIARCDLHRLQAAAFSGLPALTSMDLTENNLLELGTSFASLSSVTSLTLTATSLSSVGPGQLPTSVQNLELSENPLTEFDPVVLVNLTNLDKLEISDTLLGCTCDGSLAHLKAWTNDKNVTLKARCDGEEICDDDDDITTTEEPTNTPSPGKVCRWHRECSEGYKCCFKFGDDVCPFYGRCTLIELCSAAPAILNPTTTMQLIAILVTLRFGLFEL